MNTPIKIFYQGNDTSIKAYAYQNGFKESDSVLIENGYKSIEEYAFYNSLIENIIIPDDIEKIETAAFAGCDKLKNANLPISPQYNKLSDKLFQNCVSLSNIIMPDNITEIGEKTFCGCITLSNVTLPSKLLKIGKYAFSSCITISNIIIPKTVKEIDERAFDFCINLKRVELSGNTIVRDAFSRCNNFTIIYNGTRDQFKNNVKLSSNIIERQNIAIIYSKEIENLLTTAQKNQKHEIEKCLSNYTETELKEIKNIIQSQAEKISNLNDKLTYLTLLSVICSNCNYPEYPDSFFYLVSLFTFLINKNFHPLTYGVYICTYILFRICMGHSSIHPPYFPSTNYEMQYLYFRNYPVSHPIVFSKLPYSFICISSNNICCTLHSLYVQE